MIQRTGEASNYYLFFFVTIFLLLCNVLAASDSSSSEENSAPVCTTAEADSTKDAAAISQCSRETLQSSEEKGSIITIDTTSAIKKRSPVPSNCQLVMAPSTLDSENAGWGVFTLIDRRRGQPLLHGDLVLQLVDLPDNPYVYALKGLLHDYFWSAEETGGFYEGRHVVSSIPGIGMLANGLPSGKSNVLPFVPTVDEGGLTRQSSPGAGAITHYHNFTFYVQKDMQAGDEVFVNYGDGWFRERKDRYNLVLNINSNDDSGSHSKGRSVEWLRENGLCLDNIKPGRSTAAKDAGRGAFSSRFLPKRTIVAPVPVVAIPDRRVMDIQRQREDGSFTEGLKQLLLNYCYGHPESSVLLFPYGPGVSLINHGGRGKYANVKLQWSSLRKDPITGNVTLADLHEKQPMTFLLELVALRDIEPNEELLLDYGNPWIEAWLRHLETWTAFPSDKPYAPSYVQDDAVKALRTEEELKQHPYAENIFTSCFYRYSDNKDDSKTTAVTADTVKTVRWNQTRGIFEIKNLRPCNILKRQQDPKLGTVFTVQIRNRFGLPPEERLPKQGIHIVTHVPRRAIRFSDKLYTTDQHLENAFRHEISLPDDIFPEQWKNHFLSGSEGFQSVNE